MEVSFEEGGREEKGGKGMRRQAKGREGRQRKG